jgi:hypothetical protein
MSIQSPYLQRRGDTFSFRIAVPSDLRHIVGKREFIKSLQTTDKRAAVVKALMLAATTKHLFINLKSGMSNTDPEKVKQLIEEFAEHLRSCHVDGSEEMGGFTLRAGTDELGQPCLWIENQLKGWPNLVISLPEKEWR